MNGVFRCLLVPCALAAFPSSAWAGACATGDAPGGFDAASCDAGGASDICVQDGNQIFCTLDENGASVGATAFAARYGTSHPYSIWGTDGTGADFCCVFDDDPEILGIVLNGTAYADEIRCNKQVGLYDLENPPGGSSALVVLLGGFGGDDVLRGSYWQSYPTYGLNVLIFGGTGDDDILNPKGHGANGTSLAGEAGDDVIVGSDEGDKILGGPDVDAISAGGGDDLVYGDEGDDAVCGEGGEDEMEGGAGVDKLYGGLSEDWADGGATVGNSCSAEHEENCFFNPSSRPTECP